MTGVAAPFRFWGLKIVDGNAYWIPTVDLYPNMSVVYKAAFPGTN